MKSPMSYFSNLRDPRVERTREHNLEDIMFIAIASILCGAEGWYDMENNQSRRQRETIKSRMGQPISL
jgi:hypothetical protein